ncbi:MAG: hypothetical protein AAF547_24825 [Actinomycetota bacterium]
MAAYLTAADPDRVRGRPLRYLLIVILADRGGVVTVADLATGYEAVGVRFIGRPSKVVSDALRWEVGSGWVERVGRGRYRLGRIPPTTLRWIRGGTAQTRAMMAGHDSAAAHRLSGSSTWDHAVASVAPSAVFAVW